MPIEHLLRALPFVLMLGLLPGLALATAIAPRLSWPSRFATAPGLSVGVIGVIGLALREIHIGFSAVSVVPILLVLGAVAILRHRRQRPEPADRGVGWAVTGTALVSGLVLAGSVVAVLRNDPLPAGDDPSLHGAVAATIAAHHDILPVIPIPVTGSGFVRPQAAFEAADALASELGAGPSADVLLPLVMVSVLMLPLGVALLAHAVVADRRVAAMAAMLCAGLVFPASPMIFGGYPYVVDSTLVVPLVLAVACCIKRESVATNVALIAVTVLSMWVIHGLEIVTAVAVGGALWVALFVNGWRTAWRGVAAGISAGLVAVLAGIILTRPPAVPAAVVSAPSGPSESAAYLIAHPDVGVRTVVDAFAGSDLSTLTFVLLLVGIVTLVVRARGRWLLVALVIPLLCVLDVAGHEWFNSVWLKVYPWSVTDRLLGLEFFVVPVIAAVGLVAAADALLRFWSTRAPAGGAAHRTSLGWAVIVTLGVAGLATGAVRTSQFMSSQLPSLERASAEDVRVLRALDAWLPPGSIVLNHGVADGGEWITALTRDVSAEPKGYSGAGTDDSTVTAIAGACTDPSAARHALAGIQAVFIGSQLAVGSANHWSVACIGSLPGLHLIAGSASGAAAFSVSG